MKPEINISNYEAFALDYLEGSLDKETLEAFEAFLVLNPEVAEELKGMDELEPLASSDATMDKEALKQGSQNPDAIHTDYESYFAASVDDELSSKEETKLKEFLQQHPSYEKDYVLYQRAVLKPNADQVYPLKGSLKKAIPLWSNAYRFAYRAAAVLVIGLGSIFIWNLAQQEEVYDPRLRNVRFSAVDSADPRDGKPAEKTLIAMEGEETNPSDQRSTNSSNRINPSERSGRINTLPRKEVLLAAQSTAQPRNRSMDNYTPSIRKWVDEPVGADQSARQYAQATEPKELNVPQFVGKQFGLDPAKTPTTSALMKEGLIKAIDQREDVALSASSEADKRSTLQFLAGNFEFKRVNYK